MSDNKSSVSDKWNEVKVLIESLEMDMVKNINGNKSAGVRSRKGLRLLKKSISDLIRESVDSDRG